MDDFPEDDFGYYGIDLAEIEEFQEDSVSGVSNRRGGARSAVATLGMLGWFSHS